VNYSIEKGYVPGAIGLGRMVISRPLFDDIVV
jgi:hypothetical protein